MSREAFEKYVGPVEDHPITWVTWQAAQADAFERAAKVCGDFAAKNTEGANSAIDAGDARSMYSAAWKLNICADAIRALAKEAM